MKKLSTNAPTIFRTAAIVATVCSIAILPGACSTLSGGGQEYAAHGYLTPGPTGESELIGIYDNVADCRDAADAWASRQVVGNPVYADCYPVDKN